ncbi:ArgS-related anticodon-binding protein NrtL [Streptomyces sp. NPDC059454]|uniref:ArgS-related anticodon-binding protein NrtL n=1 Tax=Streptomyces sp. NPDC059454 TaxID=3346836 RepID=UPI00368565DC
MTPVELSRTVLHAVRRAVDEGELRVEALPERVRVAPPGPGGCGDYATNVALQLARPAGQPPQRVAEILRPRLLRAPGISDVVVTGPGFINISLADAEGSVGLVREVLRCGSRYGHGAALGGHTVRLRPAREVRAVVQAEALVRILRAQGAVVHIDDHDHDHDRDGIVVRPVPAPADPFRLGPDAARWALLYPAPHDRPRIGDEHLVQREGNPLFRVRYAHARTRALLRNAADLGFGPEPGPVAEAPSLFQVLADHPRVLAAAATHRAPDRLARHLVAVADAVPPLLPAVLPLGDEKPSAAHRARLALADAAGTVLAGGLSLLGIDAPDHL